MLCKFEKFERTKDSWDDEFCCNIFTFFFLKFYSLAAAFALMCSMKKMNV